MGLIKKPGFAFAAFLCAAALFAQNTDNPPPVSLSAAIQENERVLSRFGVSAAERHDALVRLARLRQLSGDIEGAAKNWLEAAAPGGTETDDKARITGAFCFASMGEWEKAATAIAPLLAEGREGKRAASDPLLLRARYLDACLAAWASGQVFFLNALADNPEYAPLKSAIYYTLWKTLSGNPGLAGTVAAGGAETWKARLLAEFPDSPEGRIAASDGAWSAVVGAQPGPFWLLFPGRESFSLTVQTGVAAPATKLPAPAAAGKVLQTGLFRAEANARSQAEKLKNAGFSPAISRRNASGAEYWVVTVPAGQNMMGTIGELKNSGFESFPVD